MRLVFMGTPSFAVPTLERIVAAGSQVLAVVKVKWWMSSVGASPVDE